MDDNYLPDPSELFDEEVDRILNSAPVQAVFDRIKKDRMDAVEEAERAEREDGPVKFLPAFTKHPAKYPPMKELISCV